MTHRLAQDMHGKPVLWTERLCLRVPADGDVVPSARFWASERSHMMGGPWTYEKTRDGFVDILDQWNRHGFSLFTVTLRDTGEPIGGIGPYLPETHPEPELGWSLWSAEHEGKGLALEAALAARDWFFATSGHTTAVSYTDPANTRSHRLCERMGATVDPDAPHPYGDEPTLTYRHHAGGRA
ncbi:GNAT family N-acetyltransferase [Frigidibacter sp. RF13]|uniref:GNAT family N-acetyltransferase n=1 Tax=Frigidibacter sp. RF13 TaxID=2997340 RepID=UPI002270BB3F|nr:GNAT family N-acetyltransferase [Frigidibacter sp. RF13]MCY1128048.1 GNAT family N-acetyltransferase [Frigidibacter sp. RF13]